jgi:hypothetical protein
MKTIDRNVQRETPKIQSLPYIFDATSLQAHQAETFDFFTLPTGHDDTTPPMGGSFSDARFAFSTE